MSEPPKLPESNPLAEVPPPRPPPTGSSSTSGDATWKGARYPNKPDAVNPDAATLREQWRYATRQYSRWYSSAWGTAILAGLSFFALGWLIKGGNPLPSKALDHHHREDEEEDEEEKKHQSLRRP